MTPALMAKLQDDHSKPNDWAHSVLCQGYKVPSDIATKLLKDEIPWTVRHNVIEVAECSSSSSPSSQ